MKEVTIFEAYKLYKQKIIPDKIKSLFFEYSLEEKDYGYVLEPDERDSEWQLAPITDDPLNEHYPELAEWQYREHVAWRYGAWCLVDKYWTSELAQWIGNRKVLSVMSGHGCLEYALKQHDVSIIATDLMDNRYTINEPNLFWLEVEQFDCVEAIKKHKDADILLMSWPPYKTQDAFQCLEEWRSQHTNKPIIYIGERYGGCTADNNFHKSVKIIKDTAIDTINEIFPRYYGIHDKIFVCE
jgi:hypothetical protein